MEDLNYFFPAGIAIAGRSARLAGAEKMSLRYIETGSFNFSPSLNGRKGTAGYKSINFFKSLIQRIFNHFLTNNAFVVVSIMISMRQYMRSQRILRQASLPKPCPRLFV